MNGRYDEHDALRPAPVAHSATTRSPLAPTGNAQNQQLSPSHSTPRKQHHSHHHAPEPTFDIRQHPSAIAYAAAHPNRTIPKFGPYILLQTLGEGEFGKVKLGLHSHWAEEVAVKLIRRGSVENDVRMQKIRREIAVLESLHHPNIVRLYETIETDKYIGIILDYASGGELFDHILAHRYLKEKDARKLFAQLISAVWYIHQKKIVHRDLKLENLLLDRNRNIIVTDFGFANRFEHRADDLMQTSCGSPCYAAPELVISEGMYVGSAVDIWSCGVILYAMLAGYLPFDDDPENPEGDNIQQLYRYILNTPLTFPDHVSLEARDLLQKMLVPDPALRATLQVVMDHPWLEPYSHLFTYSIEESEKMSKEMQDAKKHQYRKQMREREKAAKAQFQRQERHQTHHAHGDSSAASRDRRDQLHDASMGQAGGDFDARARRGGRAVASAIVMPTSPPEEDQGFSIPGEEAGHDPFAAVPNGAPIDVNGLPPTSRDSTAESRQRKASTKSHSSKKGKRGDSAGTGASPTVPAGPSGAQKGSSKKAGAFRHTIQLEYDDSPEVQPAPPTPPRPSSKSKRASTQQMELDNPEFGPSNGNAYQQDEAALVPAVIDPAKQSPTRSRRSSNTQRPQVPIPAVPAIPPASFSPTGRRASNSSPVLTRNPATDPGPFDSAPYDTSATQSSAGITPLSSPPIDRDAPYMPSSSPVTPVTSDSHTQDKSSQEKPSRPASTTGRKHTRGISIDRIVGIGKMLTGTGKESDQSQNNGAAPAPVSKRTSFGIPKRPSSKSGKKREEAEAPPALPKDAAETANAFESKSTIAITPTGTADSSTTVGPAATASGGHATQDANMSESTSGSVKDSSASAGGSKKRTNRTLSLMVDPITKIKEQRARNRASVTVGADSHKPERERKSRQSTPMNVEAKSQPHPFGSIPDDLALPSEKPAQQPQASTTGWRIPLFRDVSMRGQHRPPAQRAAIPTIPVEVPPQNVDPYTMGASLTGMAPSGATTKSQGVMDWFRRKSLAKARGRSGSSAEPPIIPPQPHRHNTTAETPTEMEASMDKEATGERAKTPTQMEPRDEAKTPTRSSFKRGKEGKSTPSVIVTAAGEPTSSANSQRESVNSSSTTPSRMDRMVGAIKNVTHTPPAVHVPGAINKRSMGASSGGSFGGSSSGGASYTKQVLRLHDGPVDPSTLSSAPPQEIILQVLEVLKSLGIEYTKESEFRYRCVRPKKRKPATTSREPSGSGVAASSSTSGVNGVDKRGLPIPSSNSFAAAPSNMFKYIMRRSSSQAPPLPTFGNTPPLSFDEDAIDLGTPGTPEAPAGTSDYVGTPAIEPIYGDKPDQHDEVRFSVEVTKIDRLDDLLSLDIRRLKGNLKSYKFLYDIVRERCNLQR